MSIELLANQGRSRVYGGLASVSTSLLREMRNKELRTCFSRFDEADFRLEYVNSIRGIDFINDAAARNVNATWYSLQRMEGGIVWIAFGGDDTTDYARLQSVALRKVRMLICVGADNSALHTAFRTSVPIIRDAVNIASAVHQACYCGLDGVKVLFSPATRIGLDDESAGLIFRHEVNEL